jgi:very-short-patch-repair endonuclease
VSPIHMTVDGAHHRPRVTQLEIEDPTHSFFRVRVHRYTEVGETPLMIDGIHCVDAARALIDIAPSLSSENLEAAFERARVLNLVTTEELARRFARIGGRGRPGTPKIRELLARAQPNALESKLEVKAWRLLRAARLTNPTPQLRVDVAPNRWYRLDFAWPELLVAFETEGFEWHGSRARWKQDRVRTAALERLGWRIVVATWDDVVHDPVATTERVAMVLAERRSTRPAA